MKKCGDIITGKKTRQTVEKNEMKRKEKVLPCGWQKYLTTTTEPPDRSNFVCGAINGRSYGTKSLS